MVLLFKLSSHALGLWFESLEMSTNNHTTIKFGFVAFPLAPGEMESDVSHKEAISRAEKYNEALDLVAEALSCEDRAAASALWADGWGMVAGLLQQLGCWKMAERF